MAKRKKKKKRNLHQQKILRARHRNKFIRKIKHICALTGNREAFRMIPKDELTEIYKYRYRVPRLEPEFKEDWMPSQLKITKMFFSYMLKERLVPVLPEGPLISLNDLFTAGYSLKGYLARLNDNKFPAAASLKQLMKPFTSFNNSNKEAIKDLMFVLNSICLVAGDICSKIYWSKIDIIQDSENSAIVYINITIHCEHVEQKVLLIDQVKRPVFKVGFGLTEQGVDYITIPSSSLNTENKSLPTSLGVYVQSHAMQRLTERIDCLVKPLLHHHLYESFLEVKTIPEGKNRYLIEYRIQGFKVGYFLASVEENILVLRTFLFLTNNGTPEGKKLYRNTGLKKLDKQYLAIDKASTFLASDIWNNPDLRKIFTESGCESLIGLSENDDFNDETLKVSGLISKYMQLLSVESPETEEVGEKIPKEQFQFQES